MVSEKGDKISGNITFQNWNAEGKHLKLDCGKFVLDSIKFSGGPLKATFGALAIPASESFKSRERTKTWKKVTVKKIATEIAKRYKLNLSYSGPSITISAIEQSEKSDSAFLYEVCKSYGLSMKVFNSKIVIYDQTAQEKKKSVATLKESHSWMTTGTMRTHWKEHTPGREYPTSQGKQQRDQRVSRTEGREGIWQQGPEDQ